MVVSFLSSYENVFASYETNVCQVFLIKSVPLITSDLDDDYDFAIQ